MKPFLIILLLLVLKLDGFACECVSYYTIKETDENSLERSDLVLLAEVIEAGTEYVIVVKEIFKGKIAADTLIGTAFNDNGQLLSNCIYYPSHTGVYLIYANNIDESD